MMENQWVQWVPLFGFGSVVTILIAIFGVGIGLWRNASIAHRNISENIDRVESRLESRLGGRIDNLGAEVHELRVEVRELSTGVSAMKIDLAVAKTDLKWIRNQMGGPAG
jgi:hypothetical protein